MTNETLEFICRNANIDVGVPISDIGVILDVVENTKTRKFQYLKNRELTWHGLNLKLNGKPLQKGYFGYQDIIILLGNNVSTGIIYPMGEHDLHFLVLKEYQNKGIMSNFMNSGVIRKIRPRLSSVSTNYSPKFQPEMYNKIKHLVSKAGLKLLIT